MLRQKEKAEFLDCLSDMLEEYEDYEDEEYEEEEELCRGMRPEDVFLVAAMSPRAQEAYRRGWEERERERD
jgi:hypothetical protein